MEDRDRAKKRQKAYYDKNAKEICAKARQKYAENKRKPVTGDVPRKVKHVACTRCGTLFPRDALYFPIAKDGLSDVCRGCTGHTKDFT